MLTKPRSAFVGKSLGRGELLGQREVRAVGEVVAVDEEQLGVASRPVVELELFAGERFRHEPSLRRPGPGHVSCLDGEHGQLAPGRPLDHLSIQVRVAVVSRLT